MKPLNIVFQNPDPHQMDHCYKKQTILYYNPNLNPNPNPNLERNNFLFYNIYFKIALKHILKHQYSSYNLKKMIFFFYKQ